MCCSSASSVKKGNFTSKGKTIVSQAAWFFFRILYRMDIYFKKLAIYQSGITMNISSRSFYFDFVLSNCPYDIIQYFLAGPLRDMFHVIVIVTKVNFGSNRPSFLLSLFCYWFYNCYFGYILAFWILFLRRIIKETIIIIRRRIKRIRMKTSSIMDNKAKLTINQRQ